MEPMVSKPAYGTISHLDFCVDGMLLVRNDYLDRLSWHGEGYSGA